MDLNLKDKVILVSGGAGIPGSIGETIVREIAKEGGIPAIVDRNARGYGMEEELQKQGIDASFLQTDLTNPDQCQASMEKIIRKYGRIDGLVNNVGVNDGVSLDASYEAFMDSLKLNLVSYFLLAKYAVPLLKASKGSIVNIGSKVAMTGQGGTSGYAAAKGGVLGLTREWAVELLSSQVRVNALVIAECHTPAYDTWLQTLPNSEEKLKSIADKIPLENRMTRPEEISNMVLFLLSGLSSHTTGQFLFVDGGYVHLDRAL
ncbi:SDR family oxidoreductase [Pontibacter sp. E15-1]|uniref:SDR family oxidoreductase n=1 Tax=Pontibacter sp. E15-1 TaxID=2919918 RepID=UPI001F501F75|nr:SDR family oxidoreductase [Pontibacter sp. E15-1]MCJ8164327.1 SDR family oxidoreductase [Pontibacter sp. E15-1]